MTEPDILSLLIELCGEYKVTFALDNRSYGTMPSNWRVYAATVVVENGARKLTGYGNASGETDEIPRLALLEALYRVARQVHALKELP